MIYEDEYNDYYVNKAIYEFLSKLIPLKEFYCETQIQVGCKTSYCKCNIKKEGLSLEFNMENFINLWYDHPNNKVSNGKRTITLKPDDFKLPKFKLTLTDFYALNNDYIKIHIDIKSMVIYRAEISKDNPCVIDYDTKTVIVPIEIKEDEEGKIIDILKN